MSQNLQDVDWTRIPAPEDDGAAAHLTGMAMPALELMATIGRPVPLTNLSGTTIIYVYPMTGRPDRPQPDDWDMTPGARGCTPQSCAYRDHYADLHKAGATRVFGLSTQDNAYQKEAVDRLNLPFPLLSDAALHFGNALRLPRFQSGDQTLLKRLTLISRASRIMKVFYPVFPPDRNAADVLDWLRRNPI